METSKCLFCRQAQAKFTYSCSFPACEVCLITHLGTEGTHISVPIKKAKSKPSAANEVCDECMKKPTVQFCLCSAPLRKFCDDCDFSHYQKARPMPHSKHPMVATTPSLRKSAYRDLPQEATLHKRPATPHRRGTGLLRHLHCASRAAI